MSSTRSIKTLGLAGLMAMMVVASIGAVGASAAEPAVYHCVAKTGGKWNAGCTAAGTTFEKEPVPAGAKIAFTSKSGVKRLWSTESGLKAEVECTKDSDEGELTGARTDTVKIKFTGCKEIEPFAGACKSTGANAEEIVTKQLKSKLVWLKAETLKGLLLEAESGDLADFKCPGLLGEIELKVTGPVLGEIPSSQYNKMMTKYTLAFACEPAKSTKQKYTMYEEPPGTPITGKHLLSNGHEACEEEVTPDEITFAEPVEVR